MRNEAERCWGGERELLTLSRVGEEPPGRASVGGWGWSWGCAGPPKHQHPHGEAPPLDQQPASPWHRPDPHSADSPARPSDRLEAPGRSDKLQDPLGCWRNATESQEHPTEGTDPSQWICACVKVFGASRALCTGEDREVKWAEPGSSCSLALPPQMAWLGGFKYIK